MKKVIAIVGPTATGKTTISLEVAKRYNCEIINGDSTQVYKHLNIGTAKITEEEMLTIKHHLIDIVEPNENYDVKTYQTEARALINKIEKPLLVGGTGLYIKAALDNYDFSSDGRSFSFEDQYLNLTNEQLHNLLGKENLEASKKIHPNNRRRVLRALQLSKEQVNMNKDEPIYNYLIINLTLPRKEIYNNINLRADKMLEQGLLAEVSSLREKGIRPNIINYKQLNSYLDGELTYEIAVNELKKATRRYAKRQQTWFNNQMETIQIELTNKEEALKEIFKILDDFWG